VPAIGTVTDQKSPWGGRTLCVIWNSRGGIA
jgi:hypothetical protein